ncbi:hypothetical protein PIB30_076761 [Stylosanthes scabra]|uniref:Uncharacterized protein n=1 Tax=Stylosanthes scabra TaxID=79078 RepID=A0ABU6YMY8_9FABA|nr:hypothetical protein [Stylosanthes scabra]
MESQGVFSGSRRTAGGGDGRSDRSSSSTQGVFIAKARLAHCKFFIWLDRHTEKFGKVVDQKHDDEIEDLDGHFAILGVENRITELEARLAAMERKNKHLSLIFVGWLVWVISMYAVVSMRG